MQETRRRIPQHQPRLAEVGILEPWLSSGLEATDDLQAVGLTYRTGMNKTNPTRKEADALAGHFSAAAAHRFRFSQAARRLPSRIRTSLDIKGCNLGNLLVSASAGT